MKKEFISFAKFYLTLPMFVLFVAIIGTILLRVAGASAYISKEEIPEDISSLVFDEELFPADMLDELPMISENMHPIIAKTIRSDSNILNETVYSLDEEEILTYLPEYSYSENEPLVLVIHTHATECYFSPEQGVNVYYTDSSTTVEGYYDENKSLTRSEDCEKNVVAVGHAFCEVLLKHGIPTLHCTELFDLDDYNTAYSKSARAIEEYLKKYPSIKLVIDIHRDSLVFDNKAKVKTVAGDLGEKSAQVMIVAGSDAGGSVYPSWKRNLALDLKLKEVMDTKYPSLARPIFFRGARYNQHLPYSSFLLEVGTCANTLDEAIIAAGLSAECLAEVIG